MMLTSHLSVSFLPGGGGPCLVRSAVRSSGWERSSQLLHSRAVGNIVRTGFFAAKTVCFFVCLFIYLFIYFTKLLLSDTYRFSLKFLDFGLLSITLGPCFATCCITKVCCYYLRSEKERTYLFHYFFIIFAIIRQFSQIVVTNQNTCRDIKLRYLKKKLLQLHCLACYTCTFLSLMQNWFLSTNM